jgi:hypothetical protein
MLADLRSVLPPTGRTWTHTTIEDSIADAHAVEFSKTAKPLQEVLPSEETFSPQRPKTPLGANDEV